MAVLTDPGQCLVGFGVAVGLGDQGISALPVAVSLRPWRRLRR
ncbi:MULTISPECIES: hypothetical protein [unclassified Streptomyces]|nr:hypothetical protein [Streptomyces sp. A1136]